MQKKYIILLCALFGVSLVGATGHASEIRTMALSADEAKTHWLKVGEAVALCVPVQEIKKKKDGTFKLVYVPESEKVSEYRFFTSLAISEVLEAHAGVFGQVPNVYASGAKFVFRGIRNRDPNDTFQSECTIYRVN